MSDGTVAKMRWSKREKKIHSIVGHLSRDLEEMREQALGTCERGKIQEEGSECKEISWEGILLVKPSEVSERMRSLKWGRKGAGSHKTENCTIFCCMINRAKTWLTMAMTCIPSQIFRGGGIWVGLSWALLAWSSSWAEAAVIWRLDRGWRIHF